MDGTKVGWPRPKRGFTNLRGDARFGSNLKRFARSHPQRVARWEAVRKRSPQRFKTGFPEHSRQRSRGEVIAVRRNVIAAPIHAHDGAIPTGIVRRLNQCNAARLQRAKSRAKPFQRTPLVLEISKLRDDVE